MYQHSSDTIGMNCVVVQGRKLKILGHALTSSTQPEIWSIHRVVVRTRRAKKCTKMKNARAGRAELLFLLIELLFCGVLVAVVVVLG